MEKEIEEKTKRIVKVSVRSLVEFILRTGDIDTSKSSAPDREAMLAGGRLHRKIQKSKGAEYRACLLYTSIVKFLFE